MARRLAALAISSIVMMIACTRQPSSAEDEAQARTEIHSVLEQHGQAAMRMDPSAAALAFATDARVFFPSTPEVRGRDSLTAFMGRAWSAMGTPRDVRFVTDELKLFDNAALEIGTVSYTVEGEGQPPVHGKDRYMILWTRDSTGTWTILRDMSHPAPSGPAQ